MLVQRTLAQKTLTHWRATRCKGGISVRGVDTSTGSQAMLSNLASIELTDTGVVATDENGTRHRLST